jgi:uncharacterized protein
MSAAGPASLYRLDDWLLTPEGAAVHAGEATAVIADVHLGYEWARAESGDCVVAHSLNETLARLQSVFQRARISRLVVAGDLIESPRACRHTDHDLGRLRAWLTGQGVSLLVVKGNHDRPDYELLGSPLERSGLKETCTIAGWTIGHGHRALQRVRTISGHFHPVLHHHGHTAPCFVVGSGRIILPPFSSNAAGCDVAAGAVPRSWRSANLRCIVSTGDELLDFGPLGDLRRRLKRLR